MPHIELDIGSDIFKPGNKIGLFGGSFNPPHKGHLEVAKYAIKELGLDYVLWMVSPGNPLKDHAELQTIEDRVRASKLLVDCSKIKVTGFEKQLGLQYSVDSVKFLQKQYPEVKFVWLMGADSLKYFSSWFNWQELVSSIPIAVVNRPGSSYLGEDSILTQYFSDFRYGKDTRIDLINSTPPAWSFLEDLACYESSTALRAKFKYMNKDNIIDKKDSLSNDVLRSLVMDLLDEIKAEEVLDISIAEYSSLAENFIIGSGRSSQHVKSIGNFLLDKLAAAKVEVLGYEGLLDGNWVIIDLGNIVIHLFHPETRRFYDLESMWTIPKVK